MDISLDIMISPPTHLSISLSSPTRSACIEEAVGRAVGQAWHGQRLECRRAAKVWKGYMGNLKDWMTLSHIMWPVAGKCSSLIHLQITCTS